MKYIEIDCENGQKLYLKVSDNGIPICYYDENKNEIGIPDCGCWAVADNVIPPFPIDGEDELPPEE